MLESLALLGMLFVVAVIAYVLGLRARREPEYLIPELDIMRPIAFKTTFSGERQFVPTEMTFRPGHGGSIERVDVTFQDLESYTMERTISWPE